MPNLGTCRLCGAGPLVLRRCGVCRRVVMLCEECDSAWLTSDLTQRPSYSSDDDMPCPGCRASLLANGAREATDEERQNFLEGG